MLKQNRLIIGGTILIIIGIKYLLESIKSRKKFDVIVSVAGIGLGIVSLAAEYFISRNFYGFILITIIVVIFYFIFFNIIIQTQTHKLIQIFSFIILIIIAIAITRTLNPLMSEVNSKGFLNNGYFYFVTVSWIIFTIVIYFIIIQMSFNLLKKSIIGDFPQLNNYSYLALAIAILILSGGYYYISNFSENKLKDFLLVLSFAFIQSIVTVSAMKSLDIPKGK